MGASLWRLLPLMVLLLGYDRPCESARVLGLFHFNGRSHWVMFEPLLRELARRGHDVTVVSHFPQEDPPAGYRDLSLYGSLPDIDSGFTIDFLRNHNMLKFLWFDFFEISKPIFEHPVTKDLIRNKEKYDIILTEVFVPDFLAAFQYHLGGVPVVSLTSTIMLPWGNLRVGNPDNPSYIPNFFLAFNDHMSFWERLVNAVATLFTSYGFNFFCTSPIDDLNRQYFGEDIPEAAALLRNVSLFLLNSHFSLNVPRPFVSNVVEVGGLHIPTTVKTLPKDLQQFMDAAPPDGGVVLFTFGSLVRMETLSLDLLAAIVGAFQKLTPLRFVWKADASAIRAKGLDVPKNVYTSNWLPQFDILSHPNTRAFISHGGLMGLQESVHCGVPVLGIPVFSDQRINVPSLVHHGVALQLQLEDITADKIVDSLRILTAPGSKYRARAKELSALFRDRARSPLDEAVYWVEYVTRHGGAPHLRSAVLDLAWYQSSLLDVAAVLVLSPTIFLAAIWFLGKKMMYWHIFGQPKSVVRTTTIAKVKTKQA